MNGKSFNITAEKIQQLKNVLPEIFAEEKIDWEKLRIALGENLEFRNERYVLNWAGKSKTFKNLQTPNSQTLVPRKNDSVEFDNTENIFIEGENLEVLKVLQKSYFGKIKMIYIDPPYNTGNDSFIYPDKFSETKEEYQKKVGDKNADGYLIRDALFQKNSKENGQYHSNWLNMMMPRLFLAKNILRDDGVIFVSIDDNEVHNLRLLMNEIFGEENFIEIFSWVKMSTPPGLSNKSRKTIEYILVYEKHKNNFQYQGELLDGGDQPLLNSGNHSRKLTFPKGKVLFKLADGKYNSGIYDRVKLINTIEIISGISNVDIELEGEFKWIQSTLEKEIKDGTTFIIKSDKFAIRFIRCDNEGYKAPTNLIKDKYINPVISKKENNVDTNENSSSELEKLLGDRYFNFPKPVSLIKHLINFIAEKDSIILDFFAGSGTTAHAVMQLNAEDGGNRKFICVQMPETCDENSEAHKAGYKTIAEISKERIRRAINKIKTEIENDQKKKNNLLNFDKKTEKNKLDLGFKVFKLEDSNFKQWKCKTNENIEELQQAMELFIDPVAENAVFDNMIYELLLKSGKNLNSKIKHQNSYYKIDNGEIIFMLEAISDQIIAKIIAEGPQKVIALDRIFSGNDQLKTNTVLQMKDAKIDFKTI